MKLKKIVVDSDIIADHLTTTMPASYLRTLSKQYFCYTTVFNAIELFAAAKSQIETEAVQHAMDSLKVLGISPKSAKNIAMAITSTKKDFGTLIAGVCIESKLPLVTMNPRKYSGIKKLERYSVKDLMQ